jgi:hypothetical protein
MTSSWKFDSSLIPGGPLGRVPLVRFCGISQVTQVTQVSQVSQVMHYWRIAIYLG